MDRSGSASRRMEHPMRTRVAAALAVIAFGVVAPASSALAFEPVYERQERSGPYQGRYTGLSAGSAVHDAPSFARCPMSSAAEGNANQQNFPVKQYGQVSGGYRC